MNRSNQEFAAILKQRTRKLSFNIIRLSASLKRTAESLAIRNQITRSGCSIGANYREANASRSRADFRSKIKICFSEAEETIFWLEVIEDQKWADDKVLKTLIKEVSELAAIFASIGVKLKPSTKKL